MPLIHVVLLTELARAALGCICFCSFRKLHRSTVPLELAWITFGRVTPTVLHVFHCSGLSQSIFAPCPPPRPVRLCARAVSGTGAQGFGEEVVSAMKALDGPALLMACAARHHIHMGIVTSALHMADFMSLDSALRVRPTAEALTCARQNVCVDRAVISGHDSDSLRIHGLPFPA